MYFGIFSYKETKTKWGSVCKADRAQFNGPTLRSLANLCAPPLPRYSKDANGYVNSLKRSEINYLVVWSRPERVKTVRWRAEWFRAPKIVAKAILGPNINQFWFLHAVSKHFEVVLAPSGPWCPNFCVSVTVLLTFAWKSGAVREIAIHVNKSWWWGKKWHFSISRSRKHWWVAWVCTCCKLALQQAFLRLISCKTLLLTLLYM